MASTESTASAQRGADLITLSRAQHGVLTRQQLLRLGFSDNAIAAQVAARRWQGVDDAVYALHSGPLSQASARWVALLACGDGALLSHETAADIYGFVDPSARRGAIHVTIPESRKEVSPHGVRVHRSRLIAQKRDIYLGFPVTSAADTVLDLAGRTRSAEVVVGWITSACRSGATSVSEILTAMGRRKRQRHRDLIKSICQDVAIGVHSVLERAYLNRVERAHGLPQGRRQVSARTSDGLVKRDVDYDEYCTLVELDGRRGHEGIGQHRDVARDNYATVEGKTTLRYGYGPIFSTPCDIARQVASVLTRNGWKGKLVTCGPHCTALR